MSWSEVDFIKSKYGNNTVSIFDTSTQSTIGQGSTTLDSKSNLYKSVKISELPNDISYDNILLVVARIRCSINMNEIDANTLSSAKSIISTFRTAFNSYYANYLKALENISQNKTPTANAGSDKTITQGDSVTITGSGIDSDGTIQSYLWKEGSTTLSQTSSFTKSDFTVGTHTLTLTVTDDKNATATDTMVVTVNAKTTTIQTTSSSFIGKLATGQTTTYNAYDDGYYKKGSTRSYSRDNTYNIVTDNITKLMWQDDTDAKTVTKTHSEAITYCDNLTLGGYSDWHLPTRTELLSITDGGKYSPAIDSTFKNVTSNFYWSSTTNAGNTSDAWFVVFSYGNGYWGVKSYSVYVRCVRGGQ